MTHDQIDRLVRQANPVPDLSVLETLDTSRVLPDEQWRFGLHTDYRIEADQEPEKSRRLAYVGVVGAVVAVIAAALMFGPPDDAPVADGGVFPNVAQPTRPPDAEVTTGLTGLPPEGALPSAPETGRLMVSMWEHIGAPGSFGNGWLYVYDDGRLIWERLDPDPTGGWLEQRLTPEGVELIRSELIASGLFDPDQPPPEPNDGFPRHINGGTLQVRNGDRLVYINHVVPELFERLADLWSWLPEGAWVDREAKPFVPARYAACIGSLNASDPIPTREALGGLPPAARDLLITVPRFRIASLVDADPAGFAHDEAPDDSCFDLTTEQARALAVTLTAAGGERRLHPETGGFDVTFVVFSEAGGIALSLWPMLPHGIPGFTGA